VTADVAAKAIRKAKATIAEHGADGVALLVQGKLNGSNEVVEAGLVAQVKAPKPMEVK
jgi:ribosomal protein S3